MTEVDHPLPPSDRCTTNWSAARRSRMVGLRSTPEFINHLDDNMSEESIWAVTANVTLIVRRSALMKLSTPGDQTSSSQSCPRSRSRKHAKRFHHWTSAFH